MFDIGNLATIAAAFFVAAPSPGPATIAVASQSMSAGRKAGLVFGSGLAVGLAVWGVVAAAGMGAILQASTGALTAMKLLGGAYLLWLAYGSARSAARPRAAPTDMAKKPRAFLRGLLLNLSNPKAVFAWMAVLSLGLGDGSGTGQVVLATGTCMVLGGLIYATYAVVFSTQGAMDGYARARRWIDGVVSGLFAVAGIGLIRSAFARQ
ncbi:threonine/homoserine/homoserine lactone efflux protein [Rhodobium orientis]|uniref:Lysine transporter LysE n=1 Tax=Rhodobium orientis TaxID=34017 RepID=A0A327JXZ2_9HYPH|nr:LysE family transporter [Rhodobium orientis]MBB4302141.1 threonine/homoserine/homoserine lactone efflux protein [Rhodobium orientis]MBK5948852.1 lysine transporter LysE [Rhodobium orientis]RAI27958.1 lysine transporter LysE [Rhodobium orientis]